jgi:F-type H+-transporting ATPase subunit a
VSHTAVLAGEPFVPPGPGEFEFPGLFSHDSWFAKPILIVLVMTTLCAVFYVASSRNAKIVPSKLQFAGESVYGFVRNNVALDAIGHEGLKYAPFLATLFSFIAVNNVAGIIPLFQLPATSKIGFTIPLAVIAWAVYMWIGISKHGFGGYFKAMMFPPGIPVPVYFLLAPIEFLSTVLVRPVTLALRLTLNMFAGHLVLVLFILGGEHLIFEYGGAVGIAAGSISIFGGGVLVFFEAFIQVLQAFVFTLLTALYIGGALADDH